MAPKTRSTDSPHVPPLDSPDPNSHESSLVHAHDTTALVLEQIALFNVRLDAQTANVAGAAATCVADPLSRNAVTMRTTTPRVTSSPRTSHHLHHTLIPDMHI
jgi:hypothetical protein